MREIPNASVLEAVATLQRRAYADVGLNPGALSEHFAELRARMVRFQDDNPNYLGSRDEIVEKDPDLAFVEFDFGRRFDVLTPTPFQNPWSFAVLSDYWEYHRRKLYSQEHWPLILATAPTRNYNARAIAGSNEYAVLIEDGLLHLARRICQRLAPLLYDQVETGFLPRTAVVEGPPQDERAIDEIAESIISYVRDESIVPPPPVIDAVADFGIRHVIFGGFLAFVLEHELYHLRKRRVGDDEDEFKRVFAPVWQFFDTKLRGYLPNIPTEEELSLLFRAHREELWADAIAVSRVMLLGKIEGPVGPSLSGALLFHYLAEAIRNAELLSDDPDALTAEASASEEVLAAQALYLKESHPYPQSRRASVYAILTKTAPHYKPYLDSETNRLEPIFEQVGKRVRDLLKTRG
jgi:hypothetical protein